uniref:Uncharacterized protein n=1 Tax=Nelumbo nucifera TaxID=4432 RepID=A0A822ZV58_NELNU|nr:TPA_asm: hypothetical protein HUJ06_018327 [Nelumbo nucifera]
MHILQPSKHGGHQFYKLHRSTYILDYAEYILGGQWYNTWRILISLTNK